MNTCATHGKCLASEDPNANTGRVGRSASAAGSAAMWWQRSKERLRSKSVRVRCMHRTPLHGSSGRPQGRQESKRSGRGRVPDSPVPGEGRVRRMRRTHGHGCAGRPQRSRERSVAEPNSPADGEYAIEMQKPRGTTRCPKVRSQPSLEQSSVWRRPGIAAGVMMNNNTPASDEEMQGGVMRRIVTDC